MYFKIKSGILYPSQIKGKKRLEIILSLFLFIFKKKLINIENKYRFTVVLKF